MGCLDGAVTVKRGRRQRSYLLGRWVIGVVDGHARPISVVTPGGYGAYVVGVAGVML